MGNSNQKERVDHGQVKPFGKLYPNPPEYNPQLLAQLIQKRRLAPFYPGQDTDQLDYKIKKSASFESLDKRRSVVDISTLVQDPIECPICFLYYPKNINYTQCCTQPICTDCFLQIRRPETNYEVCCCPYCVTENFAVVYTPPLSDKPNAPVTSDDLRPDWRERMQEQEIRRYRQQQQLELNQSRLRHFQLFEEQQLQSAAQAAATLLEGNPRQLRHIMSQHQARDSFGYLQAMTHMGADIEELMMMEAIRQSLQEAPPENFADLTLEDPPQSPDGQQPEQHPQT